jgi:hypothetical protein
MAQIISSQEAHIHLTHGTDCCGDGVVWTKRAAAKRDGAAGTSTGKGCASIMNQDYLDELIVTLLLLSGLLVREVVLLTLHNFYVKLQSSKVLADWLCCFLKIRD